MIRIVTVGDGDVTEIVKVSVYVLIGRENTGLHDVTQIVYAFELGQRHPLAAGADVRAGVNDLVDAIAPSLQVLKVEIQLVHWAIDILKNGTGGASGPSATGYQRIQLGEVTLRDRFAPIVEALDSAQSVAQTLAIVSAKREREREKSSKTRIITQGPRKFP